MEESIFAVLAGIIVVLLAVPLGRYCAEIYLWISGGMETEQYLICVESFIRGFHILGGICTGLGGLSVILTNKSK